MVGLAGDIDSEVFAGANYIRQSFEWNSTAKNTQWPTNAIDGRIELT